MTAEHPLPKEIVSLKPRFNPSLIRKINSQTGKQEGFSGYLRHHFQLQVPEGRQEELIRLRHEERGFVYRIDRQGQGRLTPDIFGTLQGVYGLPTRSLLNPVVLFHMVRRQEGSWVLAIFPEPTATPPEKLLIRTVKSTARRPLQIPHQA